MGRARGIRGANPVEILAIRQLCFGGQLCYDGRAGARRGGGGAGGGGGGGGGGAPPEGPLASGACGACATETIVGVRPRAGTVSRGIGALAGE